MNEKKLIDKEEAKAIQDLEDMIGISIPRVDSLKKFIRNLDDSRNSNLRLKIKDNHVTQLKLNGKILERLGTKLKRLPKSLENLNSLEILDLSHNNLTSFLESIENLSSLQYLNLGSNQLTKIPELIGKLSSLSVLVLEENELETLPESIGNLKSLNYLNIRKNNLTYLPQSIGFLKSLRLFYLSNNKLKSLPDSIGNLSSLYHLSLRKNQIETLPESFEKLISLKSLKLDENLFKEIPEMIGNLVSLKQLGLTGNKISTLPESFKNLTSLEVLFLKNTNIKELPKSVLHLKTQSLYKIVWEGSQLAQLMNRVNEKSGKKSTDPSLRDNLLDEYVKAIPSVRENVFLEKINEEELRLRELEKERRRIELQKEERKLKKTNQVKFLVNDIELGKIKRCARISQQTLSEFIRTALREKMDRIHKKKLMLQSLERLENSSDDNQEIKEQEAALSLEELPKIRKLLEKLNALFYI